MTPETRYGRGDARSWPRSRYDRRFYATGAGVLIAAIVGKLLGADAFAEYPAIGIGAEPATLALSGSIVLSGLVPRA